MLSDLLSLIYPRICAACSLPLLHHEPFLCAECMLRLPRTGFNPSADNAVKKLFAGRMRLEQAHSWLFFRKAGIARNLMHRLKYSGDARLAAYLGGLYASELMAIPGWTKPDVLVSVPMHPDNQKQRGFNQSEMACIGFSERSGIPYAAHALERVYRRVSQTREKRYARWENSEGNYRAVPGALQGAGSHVLVLDDVITTGATTEACMQALAGSGITRLSVFSLCTALN